MKKIFYLSLMIFLFSVSSALGISKVHIPVPKTVDSAKAVTPDKINNTPSIIFFYEKNGIETKGYGFKGPDNASKNIIYMINDEAPLVGQTFKIDSILTDQNVTVGSETIVADIVTLVLADMGSGALFTEQTDDPTTSSEAGYFYGATTSGDFFYKSTTGLYNISTGTFIPNATIPTVVSITIPAAGTTAEVITSESMTVGVGGSGGWTLNNPTVGMTYVEGNGLAGTPLVFNLARTVLSPATENPDASYVQPTNGFESADDGVDLASIPSASVTNNSTQTNNPYTVLFSDDFNRSDSANVQSGSPWTSEIDTNGIGSILSNAYSVAHDGTATARVSKTLSSNNSDYKISYSFKMSDVLGVDNSGSERTVLILTLQSSAGAYLTIGIGCNTAGDPYRFIVTRTNDAGSASTTYTNFTFTADQYITLTVISDIGAAATADGICNIVANSTTLLDLTGVADETRPIVSEVRLGISTSNTLWNQANTFTYDNFVMEYK